MAITERLALIVTADPRDAVRGLQGLERQADRSLRSTEDRIDRLGQRFTQAGAVMLTAGGVAAAGLVRAGMAAADLEQAVGSTEAVFGEAADTINEFARRSATAVGLSETEFRNLSSVAGAMLKNLGLSVDEAASSSLQLVEIGADLAATYGGTTREAVEALGAALRGEADPAERFGLRLNITAVNAHAVAMGLAETTSAVSDHARAQATLDLIMQQAGGAMGQFARETDTASGRMQIARAELENFKASIGQAVAPILADAASLVGDLANKFNSLPQPVQETASKLLVGVAAFNLIGGGISLAAGQAIKFRDNLLAIARTAPSVARTVAGAFGPAGLIVAGAAAAASALERLDDAFMVAGSSAEELSRMGTTELVRTFQDLTREGERFGVSTTEAFRSLAEQAPGTAERLRDALRDAGQDTAAYDQILRDLAEAERQAAADADRGANATGNLADAHGDAAASADEQRRALEKLDEAIRSSIGNDLDLESAMLNSAEAHEEYLRVLADGESTERDRQRAGIELIETYLRQGEAAAQRAEDEAIAAGRAETATEEAAQAQIVALLQLADTLGPDSDLRRRLLEYVNDLNSIPSEIETTLRVRADGVDLSLFTVTPGARAKGGPIDAGKPYVVGEEGPELIIPNHSGTVVPNHKLGGGGEVHFHVDGSTTAMAFARMEAIAARTVDEQTWRVN